jgi:hypothetical protein
MLRVRGGATNAAITFVARQFSPHPEKQEGNTYFSPEPQFLLLLALCIFFLGVLFPLEFTLVESGQVFFARRKVEFDFFGRGDGELAFLVRWTHDGEEDTRK